MVECGGHHGGWGGGLCPPPPSYIVKKFPVSDHLAVFVLRRFKKTGVQGAADTKIQ